MDFPSRIDFANKLLTKYKKQIDSCNHELALHISNFFSEKQSIKNAIIRLSNGCSMDYVFKHKIWLGNFFFLNKNVLIPRNDTESWVEQSLDIIRKIFINYDLRKLKVVDVCTGSGCIGITVCKYLNCDVVLSDISKKAIAVAKKNSKINSVKCKFCISDLFDKVQGVFDLIFINPPYVESSKYKKTDEPEIAFLAGDDGMHFYKKIANQAIMHMSDKSLLFIEIGDKQLNKVSDIFDENFIIIEVIKDLKKIDRAILFQKRNF